MLRSPLANVLGGTGATCTVVFWWCVCNGGWWRVLITETPILELLCRSAKRGTFDESGRLKV